MSGQRILVIEDDASVRGLLAASLKSRGFDVQVACDGVDGLAALEQQTPQLIIVDIMMPRLDGMTFVKAIKAHKTTRSIPIIILTAKSDPRSTIEGINVGARFYISKPFQIDELMAKVDKAM